MAEPEKKTSRKANNVIRAQKVENITASRVRRDLAIAAIGLLVVIALIAAFQNGAMPVLDKLLPLVAIIFGFFFGHKATKL